MEAEKKPTEVDSMNRLRVQAERKADRLREALEAALPVLQDYASSNPMHFYRGEWQDPRGVHAAVKLVTAALGVPVVDTPQRYSLCGNCMTPCICAEDGPGCVPAGVDSVDGRKA